VGIGAIGAANLLRKYGSLEKALAAGRFAAEADTLRVYRAIATMDKSAPLPPLRNQKPTWGEASSLARAWQLNKLAERLAGMAARGN
jgi:DNA polymerase-1